MSRASAGQYSDSETRAWLSWIARHMQQDNRSVFLVEQMQPHWLATRGQRVLYLSLNALVLGTFTGATLSIGWWLGERLDPPCPQYARIPFWLWIAVTIVWSFALSSLDTLRLPWITPELAPSKGRRAAAIAARIVITAASWLGLWVALRLVFGDGYATWAGMGPVATNCSRVQTGLSMSHPVTSAAYMAFIYATKMQGETTVRPVEALGWSWRAALNGLVLGALAGVGVWLAYAATQLGTPFPMVARNLFLYPPLGAAGGFVLAGLTPRVIREKTMPNQGIRLSLRNAVFAASLFAAVIAIVTGPVLIVALRPLNPNIVAGAPLGAASLGLIAALVAFTWRGGREVIMHASLRLVLVLTHQLPRDLVAFLDHCAFDLDFLRRVGGGYVFIHRYLLEHFAAMEHDVRAL